MVKMKSGMIKMEINVNNNIVSIMRVDQVIHYEKN